MAKAKYIALSIIKMVIWVKKMVSNLKRFGITNMDRIKEPVPILFGDNKAFI